MKDGHERIRILQVAHDHPDWTPGGTEILAHDLARALDARDGVTARFLAASTSLQEPDAAPGSLRAHGDDLVLQTGAYDRFSMTRLDGTDWIAALGGVLDRLRPDVVHLHGLDRIGAEILPVIRRLAPECRIVLTLHDYQLICANDGLLLTTGEDARCRGAHARTAAAAAFPSRAPRATRCARRTCWRCSQAVDLFVAPSAFLRDRFVDWGIAAAAHPAAAERGGAAASPPATAAARSRRNRFGFFGNIARHKGALVLLDAAARLQGRGRRRRGSRCTAASAGRDAEFRADFQAKLAAAEPLAQHLGPYDRARGGRR